MHGDREPRKGTLQPSLAPAFRGQGTPLDLIQDGLDIYPQGGERGISPSGEIPAPIGHSYFAWGEFNTAMDALPGLPQGEILGVL